MKILEAINIAKESLNRYEALNAQGKGKNMPKKIEIAEDHIARLREMQAGGRSPWHDYSDLVAMYQIENFIGKIIN